MAWKDSLFQGLNYGKIFSFPHSKNRIIHHLEVVVSFLSFFLFGSFFFLDTKHTLASFFNSSPGYFSGNFSRKMHHQKHLRLRSSIRAAPGRRRHLPSRGSSALTLFSAACPPDLSGIGETLAQRSLLSLHTHTHTQSRSFVLRSLDTGGGKKINWQMNAA